MLERRILYKRNNNVDDINARMIDRFPNITTVFYNFDLVDDDTHNNYPHVFFNSITPNFIPGFYVKTKYSSYA
jgi:hypothetical protein